MKERIEVEVQSPSCEDTVTYEVEIKEKKHESDAIKTVRFIFKTLILIFSAFLLYTVINNYVELGGATERINNPHFVLFYLTLFVFFLYELSKYAKDEPKEMFKSIEWYKFMYTVIIFILIGLSAMFSQVNIALDSIKSQKEMSESLSKKDYSRFIHTQKSLNKIKMDLEKRDNEIELKLHSLEKSFSQK